MRVNNYRKQTYNTNNRGYSRQQQKPQRNYYKIKLSKDFAIAESAKAVLFKININAESLHIWINKAAIFSSEFTNILNISLIDEKDYQYSLYKENNQDWKKPDYSISGSELIDYIANEENDTPQLDWESDLYEEEQQEEPEQAPAPAPAPRTRKAPAKAPAFAPGLSVGK